MVAVLGVNILAALAGTVFAMALGALWYSPALFAKPWMAAMGITPEKQAAIQGKMGPRYALCAVSYFAMAFVLGLVMNYAGVATWLGGAGMGALMWLGFAASINLVMHIFSLRPVAALVVDAGNHLVILVVMGIILGVWR